MISELPTSVKKIIYSSFHTFNFLHLIDGTRYADTDHFINRNGLTFTEYAGCMNFAGNELYSYPQLALALREIAEYPIVKRTYPVNKKLQGKAFIKYFYKWFNRCYWDFMKQLAPVNSQVNNLIYLHGQERQQPIINGFQEREIYQGKLIKSLTINGVDWCVDTDFYGARDKQTERLELRSLLSIERDYSFTVETAIVNTPFIGIRVKRDYKQRGHIVWYCLDTLKKVKKSDIAAWQKGH